jgi:hypothetical protein
VIPALFDVEQTGVREEHRRHEAPDPIQRSFRQERWNVVDGDGVVSDVGEEVPLVPVELESCARFRFAGRR